MSTRFLMLALFCLASSAPLRAQESPDAGYLQWQAAYDAADARVSASGSLRDALNESSRERYRMKDLAQSCRDRVSALESAASKVRFLQADYESAQRDADHFAELRDQRYEELLAKMNAEQEAKAADLTARDEILSARQTARDQERARLDAWSERVEAWRANVNAWFARVDSMSKEEGPAYNAYLSAYYEYKAEEDRFNAEVDAWNAANQACNTDNDKIYEEVLALGEASVALSNEWIAQLQAIEDFMLEEGKPALEAQDRASKKQLEWAEAATKLEELEQEQAAELSELESLLSAANAMLGVAIEALNAPPPTPASIAAAAAEPYVLRTDVTAQAVVATAPTVSGAPAAPSRVLILPSANQEADPATTSAELIRAQLQAEAIASQYAPVTEVPAAPVAPADTTSLTRAPVGVLGPAPLSYSGTVDDGSAVIVMTDEMLAQVFDPRVFISDQEYQRALEVQARYSGLTPKLEAEIARLRQQRDKTSGYSAEFEAVRAEIAVGALRDALGAYSAAFKYARTSGKLARLTAEQCENIERAFDLVKMGLTQAHVDLTPGEIDKRNLQFKTLEEATAMLVEVGAASAENKDVAAVLGNAGNVMKSYGEVQRYWTNPELAKQPKWEQIGAGVKTGIEVLGNFVPLVALGVAVEGVGERGAQWIITREAVNTLSASLQSTDEAIIYLADQLTRRQLELDKAAATIQNYEGVDPSRRRAFHIRPPEPPPAPSGL